MKQFKRISNGHEILREYTKGNINSKYCHWQHYNNLRSFSGIFSMHNEIYPNPQSTYSQHLPHLHNIFAQKQIVQSYTQKSNHHIFIDPRPRRHHTNYHSSDMLIQHQQIEQYNKRQNKFMEDDLLDQLHNGHIVENFMMLDEKDEQYEVGENLPRGRGDKPAYHNQNMLASSSQNNDVPSRNSSLSSLSDKNHFINIKANKSFLCDEINNGKVKKKHIKRPVLSKKQVSAHRGNSENEMDIQNSPFEQQSPFHTNESNALPQNHHPFYLTSKPHQNIEITRNNVFVPPQNKLPIPTFRRMDIDDQRERRQKLLKIQKIQQMGCNCKKSKCLKMYCECFNLQIFCNENCNCVSCCNQQQNEEHRKAVLDALTRNPKAFHEATQKLEATFKLGVELNEVKKGCKCKKTKCQKKYCECYNVGEKCGKFCKCEGCQNC